MDVDRRGGSGPLDLAAVVPAAARPRPEAPAPSEPVVDAPDPAPARRARRPRAFGLAVVVILLVALGVRLIAIGSGLPYSSYIDEGHFLHPTAHMIANDTFKGGHYQHPYEHPSLLYDATAVGAETYRLLGGHEIKKE